MTWMHPRAKLHICQNVDSMRAGLLFADEGSAPGVDTQYIVGV